MTDDLTKVDVRRGVDCIGVAVSFVLHDGKGKVLLHKRSAKCRDEQGNWDTGGGALEFGESFEECLWREVKEEVCADIMAVQLLGTLNVLREHSGMPTHWINICYAVKVDPAQAKIGEPDKMDDLQWFTTDALPTPMHTTLQYWVDKAHDMGIFG